MTTQIPSGSALAVQRPQKRRRTSGPRMMGYAKGGRVFKACNECSGGTHPVCKARGKCVGMP